MGAKNIAYTDDLYGYSILNLDTLEIHHYIPEKAETFIWTKASYSGTNKIAAEGCFWACDHEFEIYDFSEPERLPYQSLVKHEDLESEYNNWLAPVGWITPNEYAYDEHIYNKREQVRKTVKF